jgi:hypothetical protein
MASELYNEVGTGELEGFDRQRSRMREAAVGSAVQLVADVRSGSVPWYLLAEALQPRTPAITGLISRNYPGIIQMRESMTSSDFPHLMGDILQRTMLARWSTFPQAWRQFTGIGPARRDFRLNRAIAVDGLEGQFEAVPEGTEITYGALAESDYQYRVAKYAKGAKISWEALLNDDLGAFTTIPDRLGRGAARTLAKYVSELYLDSAGPDATFFAAGHNNIVASNPVLSITALGTAFGMLRGMVDDDGEPIMVESAVLVVGPGLEVGARNLLASTQVLPISTAGGPVYDNWITGNLSLAVDPYFPIITTTGTVGATQWILFANPNVARPAIEVSFLQGFETPQLFQKTANTSRLGGGVDQTMGDFGTQSQEYKAIIAFGGLMMDYRSAVASKGTG